ncbi:TMEM175 family protein [Lactiplantibacillus plantarum]|uniref:TMEM175 family protein n=1 Tax=Lactiplantibacillus plantarum TaxID=1590 RepID=UPI0006810E5E|nr:TMEM175 family protein [Lactiplantibacillus plantarum]
MIKKDELSRTLAFSDAVVAVALTLLVLPLTDIFSKEKHIDLLNTMTLSTILSSFMSFLVSFFVIYSFWVAHRHIFSSVREISKKTDTLNAWWLFTLVLIPAATAMNWANIHNQGMYVYSLVILINSLILQRLKASINGSYKLYNSSMLILMFLSFMILLFFPNIGYKVYFSLFFSGVMQRLFPNIFYD